MPKYMGWEPKEATGDGARKWASIVSWANRQGTKSKAPKPRLSFVQGMWQKYANRKEEATGNIPGIRGPKPGKVSAGDYLDEIKRRKKAKK